MKITIKNLQKKIPVSPTRIKRAILKLLVSEGVKKSGEITVCFVTDRKIRALNKKYLGRNYPTDVLSFDITGAYDKNNIFADIVVSVETAIRNANVFHTSPLYEANLYAIHGVLHILGYDDGSLKQQKLMSSKERKYVYTQN